MKVWTARKHHACFAFYTNAALCCPGDLDRHGCSGLVHDISLYLIKQTSSTDSHQMGFEKRQAAKKLALPMAAQVRCALEDSLPPAATLVILPPCYSS